MMITKHREVGYVYVCVTVCAWASVCMCVCVYARTSVCERETDRQIAYGGRDQGLTSELNADGVE